MFKGFERFLKDTAERNKDVQKKKRQKTRNLNLFARSAKKQNRGITRKSLWHYSTAAACHCYIILVKQQQNEILNEELRTLELCVTQPQA